MEPALSEDKIVDFISTFPASQIEKIDLETIKKSLMIKKRYKFSFWDSLVIATAIIAGCDMLYSEDMKHDCTIEKVLIRNPFI